MIGFFNENKDTRSMARLITFIWACWAVLLSGYVFFKTNDFTATIAIFTSIAGVASATKLIQKSQENGGDKTN